MSDIRQDIELISNELCRTIGGNLDFTISLPSKDESVEKLCMLVNFMLDTARRGVAELSERNAQLAEANNLKSKFFANVSHELRTPLTLILAPLDSLLAGEHGQLPPSVQNALQRIQRSALRLKFLVNDLLDIAQLEAGKMTVSYELVDIQTLVEELLDDTREVAKARQLNLSFEKVGLDEPVVTNRCILERILLNLIANALKFTPAQGRIRVLAEREPSKICLTVEDTGVGIPEDELPRLFSRFHRIKRSENRPYASTGLGLALVKEFTKLLQGTIDVESTVGKGSRFTVKLPYLKADDLPPEMTMAPPLATTAEPSRPRMLSELTEPLTHNPPELKLVSIKDPAPTARVLVIDDNLDMRSYIAEILSLTYDVVLAADGEKALEILENQSCDVVISDIMMPKLDGIELTRILKRHERWRSIPIILLTARASQSSAIESLDSGADDYLEKPFEAMLLRSRVAAALRMRRLYLELETSNKTLEQRVEQRTAELARSNEALKAANRAKDEFLATLSHELRTPLNAILGWSQILSDENLDQESRIKGLETIERNARSQNKLIDELLDLSRIIAGNLHLNMTNVDIKALMASVVSSMHIAAKAKELSLTTYAADERLFVLGDTDRLRQIVDNLISNAIKFTPRKGKITITLTRDEQHVECTVTDTGQGIEAEFLPYVFDRFRQEDSSSKRVHGGLGLGLAIVKQLVELHGGAVTATSPGRNQGASFKVRFLAAKTPAPAFPMPTSDLAAAPLKNQGRLHGLRVLVVDDNDDMRQLVAIILGQEGAHVLTATSVSEALYMIAQTPPDILLSDIGMPDRDGYDLIRSIRRMESDSLNKIPAAALTAYAKGDDVHLALEAGYDTHISKPVDPTQLIAAVVRLSGRQEGAN